MMAEISVTEAVIELQASRDVEQTKPVTQ